jgi:hypothetical protein
LPDLEIDSETVKPALRGLWQGGENFFIDKISRRLATEFTPKETLQEKVVTNVHTILYWVNKRDITGPSPSDPQDDSQFNHWEIPIQDWWAQNKGKYPTTTWADKPNLTDNVHTEFTKPNIMILEPDESTIYPAGQKINVKISSSGVYPLAKADIFVNDVYLGEYNNTSLFSFTPNTLENLQAQNELKIIAYDTAFNSGETSVIFTLQNN